MCNTCSTLVAVDIREGNLSLSDKHFEKHWSKHYENRFVCNVMDKRLSKDNKLYICGTNKTALVIGFRRDTIRLSTR